MSLLGGIIVFISGWVLESKDYFISNIQGMWSLSFGTTNNQELVSWHQPTSVGAFFLLVFIVPRFDIALLYIFLTIKTRD
jgi:hypothetical protein